MDGLEIVQLAQQKGLRLHVIEGKLIVRGPRCHAALAKELLDRKAEVIAVLMKPFSAEDVPVASGDGDETSKSPRMEKVSSPDTPVARCAACHVHPESWKRDGERATCPACGKFMGYVKARRGHDGTET